MEKGTRFRVVGPLNSFDTERGIRIGDTGIVLQGESKNRWCKMDKNTLPGWWQEPDSPNGGLRMYAREHGISVKRLACMSEATLAPIATAPKPRKAPKLQDTSLEAKESQKDKAPVDREIIMGHMKKHPRGTTCDRLEVLLGMSHQTASARINDLARAGRIVDSGRREKTRTGRNAICWKVVV